MNTKFSEAEIAVRVYYLPMSADRFNIHLMCELCNFLQKLCNNYLSDYIEICATVINQIWWITVLKKLLKQMTV